MTYTNESVQRGHDALLAQLEESEYRTDMARIKAEQERDEAKRHLRQLLHALDSEIGPAGKQPSRSVNVVIAVLEARRYLQAPAGREEE